MKQSSKSPFFGQIEWIMECGLWNQGLWNQDLESVESVCVARKSKESGFESVLKDIKCG